MFTQDVSSFKLARSLIRDHQLSTPFLYVDQQEVLRSIAHLRDRFPLVKLFYAMKANPSRSLLKTISAAGLSFDVASVSEICEAVSLGIPGRNLLLSAPYKTSESIEAIFEHEIAYVAVDSIGELHRLRAYQRVVGSEFLPKIFVRLRLKSTDVAIDLNSKFGCSDQETIDIFKTAVDLGFEPAGISFHVGTQSTYANNHIYAIRQAMAVAHELKVQHGIKIPIINIGGGFCDPIAAERNGVDLADYYRNIANACNEARSVGFEIFAEPGRAVVASAGYAVTSVIGTNVRDGKRWAYLDDGVYGNYSIKLYENPEFDFHRIESASEDFEEKLITWTAAGPTCCSLDMISEKAQLPEDLVIGDILLTPNLGAYSTATATNFNGFGVPKTYVVRAVERDGKVYAEILDDAPFDDVGQGVPLHLGD